MRRDVRFGSGASVLLKRLRVLEVLNLHKNTTQSQGQVEDVNYEKPT